MDKDIQLLPMAITQVDAQTACVAGLSRSGQWIRPENVPIDMVDSKKPLFCYHKRTRISVDDSTAGDARIEDRRFVVCPDFEDELLDPESRKHIIQHNLDDSVDSAFAGERSVGLIHAHMDRMYFKRATGGRRFLRAVFSDDTEAQYDWIVPELEISRRLNSSIDHGRSDEISESLDCSAILTDTIYLCVSLTKPNNRFPGKFRGCHPLVVGIHAFP